MPAEGGRSLACTRRLLLPFRSVPFFELLYRSAALQAGQAEAAAHARVALKEYKVFVPAGVVSVL